MTNSRPLTALALLLGASLALGACGGSTPAATATTPATTPAASQAPAESDAPTSEAPTSDASPGEDASPSEDAGTGIDIGSAAASLDDLDNYSFKIVMKAEGASEFMMVPSGGFLEMAGSVILRPEEAVDVSMTTSDGSVENMIGYRIIGDTAFVNLGGDAWMSSPAEDAESAVEGFKPQQMLSTYSGLQDLDKVADEDRNGIPCEHWSTSYDPGVGDMFGLPSASWTSDVWIAKDGGYVVSAVMVATGRSDSGDEGSFTMSVDLTGVNDPDLKIEKPEDVMELPG